MQVIDGIIKMDTSDLHQVDLNLLVSLHTLFKYKNVTHAAQAIKISQPALSAQLAKLRVIFNDPLLIPAHEGKGMVLTEKAEALQQPLINFIDCLHVIYDTEPRFHPQEDSRVFKIAVSDSASVSIVAPLIQFLSDLPNQQLQIEFVPYYLSQITHQLERDQVDLVIDLENNLPKDFPSLLLMDEDLVLCFRQGHALQQKPSMTIEEYCDLEHIVVRTNDMNLAGYTDIVLQSLGYKRFVRHSISHFLLAVECLQRTDYVCTLPRNLAERGDFGLAYMDLPFQSIRYRLRMIWHPKKQSNPAIQWLRTEIFRLVKADEINKL
ncbi:LysR family transcriptional regulator [Acinetobacter baumannii]|uniref:LysR family transcriptional regulator n=2 Tax=Acinetobacter calcoaceticus/baumannii complex TaxID=909768 RepID=UPI0021C0E8B2|nr:LysR family transcriptional regulator [Acinetobacter nosocomialis]EKT9294207.1 LysR family transcriptional regulator [Acinetobacter baumannii]EKV7455393.1 LysR family transcriptional regulator [Acinetobacter baumannii]EKW1355395.1 LysR family transcriptional regulator [Acinetobacter baumannii]MCT9283820.1 LysR family transcriptional regulator [Acinetobacter baumannii]HEM7310757.1 LysR family transcriptional regulator [Acinetobacter baumannii]